MSAEDLLFKVGADTGGFDKALSGMGKNLLKFTAGFFAIQQAGELFKYMATEAIAGEKSLNLLSNSIAKAHGGSGALVTQMDALSNSLAKTYGISDDLIKNGFMRMTDATGDARAAFKAMEPAIALSIARNIDLTKAMDLVTRAYMNGTDSLKKEKIYMDDNYKGMEALEQITKKYNGTMMTYKQTTDAVIKGAGESWEQLSENLGGMFLPIIKDVAQLLNETFTWWDKLTTKLKPATEAQFRMTDALIKQKKAMEDAGAAAFKLNQANAQKSKYNVGSNQLAFGSEAEKTAALQAEKDAMDKYLKLDADFKAAKIAAQESFKNTVNNADVQFKSEEVQRQELLDKTLLLMQGKTELDKMKLLQSTQLKEKTLEKQYNASKIKEMEVQNTKEYALQQKYGKAFAELDKYINSSTANETKNATGELSKLMGSRNETLFNIGKAAAVANIAVQTAQSAMSIYAGLSTIPFVGAVLGAIGAAAAIAFGAEQTSTVMATNFNPQGAATGLFNDTGESLISTFQPTEAVIPQRFSEGIRRGDYALTSGNTTNNNGGAVHLNMNINSNGLDNAAAIVREQIIPEFKKYLINERGGSLGRITGNTVAPNF